MLSRARAALPYLGLLALAALPVLVVLPPPVALVHFAGASPQAAWPLLWLMIFGFTALVWLVGRASWPVAALLAWMGARTLIAGLPLRSVLVLTEVVAVVALYAVVAHLPTGQIDRWLLGGLVVAGLATVYLGLEDMLGWSYAEGGVRRLLLAAGMVQSPELSPQALGLSNAPEIEVIRRGNTWYRRDTAALPHAWLTHPNFVGLFLLACLPAAWMVGRGRWWVRSAATLPILVVLVASRTRAAIAGAVLLGAVALWRGLRTEGRRLVLLAVLAGSVIPVSAVATWWAATSLPSRDWTTLGGRLPVWVLGWEAAMERPWLGWGLGTWRAWVNWPGGPIMQGRPGLLDPQVDHNTRTIFAAWWSDGAFSEPLQLVFELGAVWGVVLGAAVAGQALWDAWRRRHDPIGTAWGAVVLGAAVTAWVSLTFHSPALALPVVLAAARLRAPWR